MPYAPTGPRPTLLAGTVLALLLAACGTAGTDDAAAPTPSPTATDPSPSPTAGDEPLPSPTADSPTPAPTPSAPLADVPIDVLPSPGQIEEPTMDPDLQAVVDLAIADLESRVGAGDATELVVARQETFPNGALGCPKEGEFYTQALVDGYRIVLRRGDRVWLYTGPLDGEPQLCPSDEKDGGHGFVPPPGIDE